MTIAKAARAERLVQRAAELAQRGKVRECVAALREAVRLAPEMTEAAALLARLEKEGVAPKEAEPARAAAPAAPVLGRLEPSLQLPLRWAEACEADGREDAALAAYEEAAAQGAALGRPTFERFCALARAGRCAEAIAEGKSLARSALTPWEAQLLTFPWRPQHGGRPGAAEKKTLAALERAAAESPRDPWPRLYLLQLQADTGGPSSAGRRRALSGLIPRSWRWMRLALARQALRERGLEEAAREYAQGCGGTRPADWRAEAFHAETLVCLGRSAEAFNLMDRAALHAGQAERGEALSWKGELLLWLGRYEEALSCLDEAVAAGARFAWCWRGAAKIKRGRLEEGLADVENGLKAHPRDWEALSWKAEALRLLGRHAQAAAVLIDPAPEAGRRDWVWLLANRALSRAALGDRSGAEEDLAAIDGPAKDWLEREAGKGTMAARLAAVERLLDAAQGFRRPEEYGYRLFLPVGADDCA